MDGLEPAKQLVSRLYLTDEQIGDSVIDMERIVMAEPSELMERYCDHCETETLQEVHDSDHERDSSGDWRRCTVCGWTYSGVTGEYEPPAEKNG